MDTSPPAMPIIIGDGLSFCGRALSEEELALIRQITREYANLALTELAATLCELLGWQRPNGGLKTRELHKRGWLPWLPAPQPRVRRPERVKKVAEPRRHAFALSSRQTSPPIRTPLPDPISHSSQREKLPPKPSKIGEVFSKKRGVPG